MTCDICKNENVTSVSHYTLCSSCLRKLEEYRQIKKRYFYLRSLIEPLYELKGIYKY